MWGLTVEASVYCPGGVNFNSLTVTLEDVNYTACHISDYGSPVNFTDVALNQCNKEYIIMGCSSGLPYIDVFACARRSGAFNPVGSGTNAYTEANNAWWYFDLGGPSIGVHPIGESPRRTPCITGSSFNRRICWPMNNNGFLNGLTGTCGSVSTSSGSYKRIIYHRDAPTASPTTTSPSLSPSTSRPSVTPSNAPVVTPMPTTLKPTTGFPTQSPSESALAVFSGVASGLSLSSLTGGWSLCHSSAYDSTVSLSTLLNTDCKQGRLLLGCRFQGTNSLVVAAQSIRSAVTNVVPDTANAFFNSNGVDFFFSTNYSWGFSPQGSGVERTPCSSLSGFPQRMCWPTQDGAIVPGGRCGDDWLSGSTATFERVIYQALDPVTARPTVSPWTSDPTAAPTSSRPSKSPTTARPSRSPSRVPSTTRPSAAPFYVASRPLGVMTNVPTASLARDWTVCHSSTWSVFPNSQVDVVLGACNKKRLMIACRTSTNSPTFVIAAQARRDMWLQDVGTGAESFVTDSFNPGVKLYYSAAHSFGFAGADMLLDRTPCSTSTNTSQLGLCLAWSPSVVQCS